MSQKNISIIFLFFILFNICISIDYKAESLRLHFNKKGKIEVQSKIPVKTKDDLFTVYTPGVLEVSNKILADNSTIYKYTLKSHMP